MRRKGSADLYAGNLRHRVAILARKTVVVSGKTSEHWETLFECWADIEPIKGREYFDAAAVNREDSVRFVIRYRPDVTAEMTIRHRGVDYNIESVVNPDMRGARLEILARSVT